MSSTSFTPTANLWSFFHFPFFHHHKTIFNITTMVSSSPPWCLNLPSPEELASLSELPFHPHPLLCKMEETLWIDQSEKSMILVRMIVRIWRVFPSAVSLARSHDHSTKMIVMMRMLVDLLARPASPKLASRWDPVRSLRCTTLLTMILCILRSWSPTHSWQSCSSTRPTNIAKAGPHHCTMCSS